MEKVNSTMREELMFAKLGREPPDYNLRELYALPLRLGGLNILAPSAMQGDSW